MLFEMRLEVPEVSDAFVACRDLFMEGRVREARAAAEQLRTLQNPSLNDLLLCVGIARACGLRKRFAALAAHARRRFPGSVQARLVHALSLASRPSAMSAIRALDELSSACEPDDRPHIHAMLAAACARAGLRATALRHAKAATEAEGGCEAAIAYELCWTAIYLTDWPEAIAQGARAVRLAPRWPQARCALVSAHLALGQATEAGDVLADWRKAAVEDESMDLTQALIHFSENRMEDAAALFDRYRDRWPKAAAYRHAMVASAIARWSLGQPGPARIAARAAGHGLEAVLDHAKPDGTHGFIPSGYVAQRFNQCLPTAAAIVARAQGCGADPDSLFRRMHGTDGAPLWRMRQVMEEDGFKVLCLRADPGIVRGMLDRGVPLMGCTETLFGSHVEVVCGYHSGLGLWYLRDPMVWYPGFLTEEELAGRYASSGGALFAVLAPGAAGGMEIPPEWIADVATHLLDLEQACRTGCREEAERHAAAIPDGGPEAFLRDRLIERVVIGPMRFRERMRAHAFNPALPALWRWKTLLTLPDHDAALELKRMADEELRHPFHRELAAIRMAQATGADAELGDLIRGLLDRYPEMTHLWAMQSDTRAQAGDLEGARESLARALEISPDAPHLHQREERLRVEEQPYARRLERADTLCRAYPDAHELKGMLAEVLCADPDGRRYEAACREVLRYFPRDPAVYVTLINWYLAQEREDLARALLEEGRRLLGMDELPLAAFERTPATPAPPESKPPSESGEASGEELLKEAGADLAAGRAGRPDEWPSVRRLLEYARAGRLPWEQEVRTLALRLLWPGYRSHAGRIDDLIVPLLPSALPGPGEVSATLLIELLMEGAPDRRVAETVLAWIERALGESRRLLRLRLLLALLREQAGLVQDAIEDLQKLCHEAPAFSPARFQMGRVRAGQGRVHEAAEQYRACLEGEPGHAGSLMALRDLCDTLGRADEADACQARLLRRVPYSFDTYLDSVRRATSRSGPEAGLETADRLGSELPPSFTAVARSEILLDAGRLDEASSTMDPFSGEEGRTWPVHAMRTLLAIRREDFPEVERLAAAAMERWPRQSWIFGVYAERLAARDEAEAVGFVDARFADGRGDARLALLRLRCSVVSADQAVECVNATPAAHRAAAIDAYAAALNQPESRREDMAFLEWVDKHAPEHRHLRYRLAMQCDFARQHQEAVEVATRLLKDDPEHPAYLHLLGRCAQDVAAKAAGPYLERAAAKDRSSEHLLVLARNYQVSGLGKRARELYREVLGLNPVAATAMSNLYLLGEAPSDLWDPICVALRIGGFLAVQYFHVTAVQVAKATRNEVPAEWIVGASERWRLLNFEIPFFDERDQLRKSLYAWHTARGERDQAKKYGGLFTAIAVRLIWPGFLWVPGRCDPHGSAVPAQTSEVRKQGDAPFSADS